MIENGDLEKMFTLEPEEVDVYQAWGKLIEAKGFEISLFVKDWGYANLKADIPGLYNHASRELEDK
eukprot:CAMPEP_0114579916 /NCGR_PEP_ID=MMETSP0125-20121206/4257_1 /TAXON_ID=485358 ORGANISM="Aristerostoma sp., Strain ATCC 50986" /NCGR_SAMPLE_ID=MMETSP0125 /ASSEMBLY_ACC=CAM_ASM_000245 /LENGTH=65 /DNA_ID=CAMNT_0001771067 /DNA_START=741 /DNA_END=938 /DNA_ORIENTATION=+